MTWQLQPEPTARYMIRGQFHHRLFKVWGVVVPTKLVPMRLPGRGIVDDGVLGLLEHAGLVECYLETWNRADGRYWVRAQEGWTFELIFSLLSAVDTAVRLGPQNTGGFLARYRMLDEFLSNGAVDPKQWVLPTL